jgi:endonuclease III
MTTKRRVRLTEVIKEIEALAKRLRTELRSVVRKSGLTKNLEQAAAALRKQAALLVAQVERYVHELRMELARGTAIKRPAARRKRA